MSTTTTRRRGAGTGNAASENINTLDFAAIGKLMDLQVYGKGEPLYSVLQKVGTVNPINDTQNAFDGYNATKRGLKAGECGFAYSEKYDAYSLGISHDGGIIYASVQHDADGQPLELDEFVLCVVEVKRDFKVGDQVIMEKGKKMLKALDPKYKGF